MKYDSCLKKILKYISIFIVTYLSLLLVPKTVLAKEETIIICMIITTFYAFMEIYFPSVYIDKFVV
jgi:phosphoglycerol transferase MdoB-like AlkP superfamily enzyme